MRCGKQEHQQGQKCSAKNAKCKDRHKIGHFHKVCQSKKRAKQRANLVQTLQDMMIPASMKMKSDNQIHQG